jgi:hypothetical protein
MMGAIILLKGARFVFLGDEKKCNLTTGVSVVIYANGDENNPLN